MSEMTTEEMAGELADYPICPKSERFKPGCPLDLSYKVISCSLCWMMASPSEIQQKWEEVCGEK